MIAKWSKRLIERLKNKEYRDAYVEENVRTGISYQIRALRDQRNWNQGKLALEMDKPQSVVSRLENPDYGKLSVQTLLEVAAAFDVALVIQYVSFSEFLRRSQDVSPKALRADSFDAKHLRTSSYTTASFGNGFGMVKLGNDYSSTYKVFQIPAAPKPNIFTTTIEAVH